VSQLIKVAFLPRICIEGAGLSERALLHVGPFLREHGILWGVPPDEADLVWAVTYRVPGKPDRPYVVHAPESVGGLWARTRTLVGRPEVKLVVKTALYRPVSLVNAPHYGRSIHEAIVYRSMDPKTRPQPGPARLEPLIAPEHFHKIRLGFNWAFLPEIVDRMRTWKPFRYNRRRDIEVFFAGATDYGDRRMVTRHRQLAVETMRRLPGKVIVGDMRAWGKDKYWELLERSKVVVSPWGHAATCIRAAEAILAGCALVKPYTPFTETWPDYHALDTCFSCAADFSNLAAIVAGILDRWSDLEPSLMSAAYWLRDFADYRVLARRIAGLVCEALGEELHGIDRLRWDFPWPSQRPPVPEDPHGWFDDVNRQSLEQFLSDDTRLILELGSWLGKSARWMLDQAPNATLAAIDTWNGNQCYEYVALRDELPTLYSRFLGNGWPYRDRLIPIRRRSVDGMRLVAEAGLSPDLIYVDADHHYPGVKADLETAAALFPATQLVGDDYRLEGVKRAVDEFAHARSLHVKLAGRSAWWLEYA